MSMDLFDIEDCDDIELIGLGARLDSAWSEQAALEAVGASIEDVYYRTTAIVDQIEDHAGRVAGQGPGLLLVPRRRAVRTRLLLPD